VGSAAFCSWNNVVVDNLGKPQESWEPLPKGLKIPEGFAKEGDMDAFLGWGGIVLFREDVCVPELIRGYMDRIQAEASCGQCFPCRVGTRVLAEILGRITSGRGSEKDLETLRSLALLIKAASKCTVGQTSVVPLLVTLDHFSDRFRELIEKKQAISKSNLITFITAPCSAACPAHLDIPTYVERIGNQDFMGSLERIRRDNTLPGVCGRVCVRPCEFNCRRGLVDESISIRLLKRTAADWELKRGLDCKALFPLPEGAPAIISRRNEKIVVIGAGPAGLAAALNLANFGYPVTIFEALPEGGGMAAVGIPDYRLPREALRREIHLIENLGVTIRYNQKCGQNFILADLKKQGFSSVFIAVGAHNSRAMDVEGEDKGYKGFVHGVRYLKAVALGQSVDQGEKMVVVGGGNVAIDCVRTALRLGFKEVTLAYRRTIKEMPADPVEIRDAQDEGVKFHYLVAPVKLLCDDKKNLTGLELIKMELGEPDASGRRRPVPVPGSEFVVECDICIPAIGQYSDLDFITPEDGLEVTKWNTVKADEYTGITKVSGIFSGGDCVTGPATLIQALAAGNRAAISIDRFLRGKDPKLDERQLFDRLIEKMGVFDKAEKIGLPKGSGRPHDVHMPVQERIKTHDEVELGYSLGDSIREASRCLRCYRMAAVVLREGA